MPPSFGTSSDNGFEYEQPYYWNIAPNMDATISPRLMTKRGLQIGSEFRYLNTAFGGVYHDKLNAEFLPGDRLRDGDNRYGISLLHNQTTANGFTGLINYNKVSDDDYYTDLSSDITSTSKTQLLQRGMLTYGGGGWWNASINFQVPEVAVRREQSGAGAVPDAAADHVQRPQAGFPRDGSQLPRAIHALHHQGARAVRYDLPGRQSHRPLSADFVALRDAGVVRDAELGWNYRSYSLTGQVAGSPVRSRCRCRYSASTRE